MWPFGKGKQDPSSQVTSRDGMVARFHPRPDFWTFGWQGLEFTFDGKDFDPVAFEWAKEAYVTLTALQPTLIATALEQIGDAPVSKTKARIAGVSIGEYDEGKRLEVAITGDETWGDFAVDIVVEDGEITEVYAGD